MSSLRIDVADLLAHAGARRPVHLEALVDGLFLSDVRVERPLVLDLVLERVPEGIVVRGTVHARWDAECGTCLRDLTADVEVSVSELFERVPVDGETYPIEGHAIDLDQLLRDAVLLDLPLVATCATVGLAECHAVAPQLDSPEDEDEGADGGLADPRWAALSELDL
ncbi:MAG: DUF177 domain-containing protein [Acidimicrobiia bacterium]